MIANRPVLRAVLFLSGKIDRSCKKRYDKEKTSWKGVLCMATEKALASAKAAYDIESSCITQMKEYFDTDAFSKAVDLLCTAPRIGAAGCGHSGIACQHFAHLMCCVERPARFISPAEAVHGATGFLQKGDVMVFASRGGKTEELLPILAICKAKGI